MKAQKFSKSEAIRFGWNTMKSHLGFFIVLLILVALIYVVPDILAELTKDTPILPTIIAIASLVLYVLTQMGLIGISLKFVNGDKGKLADLFAYLPLFLKYLLGSIIYGLIVFGGIILLIVPGIIWGIKFQFYKYFIVDKGLGPIEALKKSSAITKGVKSDLFLFGILLGLINFLGAVFLIIGLFATIPATMVAMAFVYRKLLAQTETAQAPEPSTGQMVNDSQ